MTKDVKELSWRRPVITAFPQYAHVLAITGEYMLKDKRVFGYGTALRYQTILIT